MKTKRAEYAWDDTDDQLILRIHPLCFSICFMFMKVIFPFQSAISHQPSGLNKFVVHSSTKDVPLNCLHRISRKIMSRNYLH